MWQFCMPWCKLGLDSGEGCEQVWLVCKDLLPLDGWDWNVSTKSILEFLFFLGEEPISRDQGLRPWHGRHSRFSTEIFVEISINMIYDMWYFHSRIALEHNASIPIVVGTGFSCTKFRSKLICKKLHQFFTLKQFGRKQKLFSSRYFNRVGHHELVPPVPNKLHSITHDPLFQS